MRSKYHEVNWKLHHWRLRILNFILNPSPTNKEDEFSNKETKLHWILQFTKAIANSKTRKFPAEIMWIGEAEDNINQNHRGRRVKMYGGFIVKLIANVSNLLEEKKNENMPITAKAVYVNYQEVILVFKLTVFEWILIFTRKWVELETWPTCLWKVGIVRLRYTVTECP